MRTTWLLLLLIPLGVLAQQEIPAHPLRESPPTSVSHDSLGTVQQPMDEPKLSESEKLVILEHARQIISAPSMTYSMAEFPSGYPVSLPGVTSLPLWTGGQMIFTGSRTSLPGLMGIEQGAVSFEQRIGNLTATAFGGAAHYAYFRGMQTQWNFGLNLHYRLSSKVSFTAFGTYASPLAPGTPGMEGYMMAPNVGGYATFDINPHWGVNVGAQTTKSMVTGRWEAQPIVQPYYKVGGKTAIGIDVGAILYNAVRSYSEQHNSSKNPPPPPRGMGNAPTHGPNVPRPRLK